jgi:hypothetical protein
MELPAAATGADLGALSLDPDDVKALKSWKALTACREREVSGG